MARMVRDAALETRFARSRLRPRKEPYYRGLDPGLSLAYHKPIGGGAGSWRRRLYTEAKKYEYTVLGAADDYSDPNGREILSFTQAQEKARGYRVAHVGATVGTALDEYLTALAHEKGRPPVAITDARYRIEGLIRPKLGDIPLSALTTDRLRRWRDALVKQAPRLRTKPGQEQRHRTLDGEDALRARRATANRVWALLRSALNAAFANDLVDSDKAWRRLRPFKGVSAARVRYLSYAEVGRLDNAIEPEFRPLLRAALHTGARYGQLCALRVADFNPDAGTLRLSSRKGDGTPKIFHVHLTEQAQAFFAEHCAGRPDSDPIFSRNDGTAFGKSHQIRPLEEASARAKISPAATFHITRHTFASHATMNGTPLLVVAQNLGHADTRMVERHYGHLSPSYQAAEIRKGAPKFNFKTDRTIVALR